MKIGEINIDAFKKALGDRDRRKDILILIVEDQKFSRLMLKNFLAKNYDVITATTGEEALAEYISRCPDVVFLDLELPGVGGQKVLELLVKLDKEAFVVMVTANNHEDDVRSAIKGGVKGFITKPYTKEKIYECMDKFIAEKHKKLNREVI